MELRVDASKIVIEWGSTGHTHHLCLSFPVPDLFHLRWSLPYPGPPEPAVRGLGSYLGTVGPSMFKNTKLPGRVYISPVHSPAECLSQGAEEDHEELKEPGDNKSPVH